MRPSHKTHGQISSKKETGLNINNTSTNIDEKALFILRLIETYPVDIDTRQTKERADTEQKRDINTT